MKDTLSALARDHIERPRNRGKFSGNAPGTILHGEAGSEASGVLVRFQLQVLDDSIEAVHFDLLGPPELIAAASCLSEKLVARKAVSASVPPGLVVARELDLPRAVHGLALLAEDGALACFDS
ncbi:MAG: iron-sulfur cluster assembly scaffold protein [Gammaproteobacteria bacterium]|nr:iron-sulfur cluster assembly scaffold protein [Gammaproteobacteria bacterium]